MIRRLLTVSVAMMLPTLLASSVHAKDVEFGLVSHCSDCDSAGCSDNACGGCSKSGCGLGGCSTGGCGLGSCGGSCGLGGCGLGGFGLGAGGCGLGAGGGLSNLLDAEPGKLFGLLDEDSPWSIGGWIQSGYYTESNGLFNDLPDRLNLAQGWMYVERAADGSKGLGLGGRMDLMYGTDASKTQAFGGDNWDTTWNRGAGYGWAMPQLYAEIASENSSTIFGHFFTLVGYEVVTAPDNFFFSHAMTMFNSEPFTHTGFLNTYNVSDSFTSYAGWTAGWDTGFESFNDGSSFLGGFSKSVGDDVTLTYITTFGNFGRRSAGFNGYSHSIVLDTNLTDKMNYVFQSDLLRVDGTGEDTVGINQYLFYTVNDCLSLGTRFEWWKADDVAGYTYGGQSAAPVSSTSYYALTGGVNINLTERTVVRPEYRYDWSPALGYQQGIFGIDWVTVF